MLLTKGKMEASFEEKEGRVSSEETKGRNEGRSTHNQWAQRFELPGRRRAGTWEEESEGDAVDEQEKG